MLTTHKWVTLYNLRLTKIFCDLLKSGFKVFTSISKSKIFEGKVQEESIFWKMLGTPVQDSSSVFPDQSWEVLL